MMASSAESIGVHGAATPTQLFVINLAASTSPMALSHPSAPALKRYTFFVSRQREDGRERFRLHMGYFPTQEEAETLLASVRDVYPAAWAGPAPTTGMGRRGRIAPGSVVAAAPVPVTPAVSASAPPASVAPTVATGAQPPAAANPPEAVAAPLARTVAPSIPTPVAAPAPTPFPAAPPLDAMSNVRDVLAQLSESASADAPTVQMRMPMPAAMTPAMPPAMSAPEPTPSAAPRAASVPVARAVPELSPVAALSLLETPARTVVAPPASTAAPQARSMPPTLPPLKSPFEGLEGESEVRLVTPEDTQTLTDIKLDRQNNAPPCFAVQLVWSVSPIDVATLPHLAIFEAYTLYNVEGNRQGRRWYGLRLGFFSDPNSATQVANYVRSDYTAVAVVPVAVKERDRANGGTTPLADVTGGPRKAAEGELAREGMEGFELLTDDRPPPAKRDLDDAARRNGAAAPTSAAARVVPRPKVPGAAAVVAAPSVASTAPKSTGKPTGKRVVARRRPPPVPMNRTVSAGVGGAEVLESTLEILGASTLSLDEGRQMISDNAARRPVEKKPSGSRFSRLLSRLGGG